MNYQLKRLAVIVTMALALATGSAAAQSPAPSENATVNLIRLLVQQGVITQGQADTLVQQAEADAVRARQAAAPADPGAAIAQPGDVRIPYIPETVRAQIRDEVKGEILAQAKEERWATPNAIPDWTQRITVEGDMRVRSESQIYNGGNSNKLIDFAAFNREGPYDVNTNSNAQFPPLLNTRQDRRNQLRVRARLGIRAELSDAWTAGIRLGSGNDDSPVSMTQLLGGGFQKKDLWLDQAYLTYRPTNWVALTGGRVANPFMSTDMLYSNDLNFDGLAAIFKHPLAGRDVSVFGTLGAFPLGYTSNSSPLNSMDKDASDDKWLFGVQVGADWKINEENRLKGAVAYYHFDNVAGKRSAPCEPWAGDAACSTDGSRPAYMQKGNTVFLLRNIDPNPVDPANTPDPQYVGLASQFNLLDLNMMWDTKVFDGMGLRLHGNYVRNLAHSKNKMLRRSDGFIANNFDENGNIESGANAWMVSAAFGPTFDLGAKGAWNVFAGYKYIEPDSLPDAYNDPTFHLGGTNARGYFIGANYAFDKNVYGAMRWVSTREIYGSPLDIDVLQLEVNARF